MDYEIKITKKVKNFLKKHDEIRDIFYSKIFELSINNFSNLDIKRLREKNNKFRLRIGKYRFLYEKLDKEIIIFFYDANSRGDIYK